MTAPRPFHLPLPLLPALALLLSPAPLPAADQPQWGQRWSRNLASEERGLPDTFDPKTGRNIAWTAKLGTETHATPLVAGGRVYIGTNNGDPRDPRHQGDRGVLMCFDENDGRLLWQLVVPKREEDRYHDWPKTGISSPVTVEGDRVYIVSSRGEVMCLDAHGLANVDLFWGKREAWLKCIDATRTGDITRDGLVWSYALNKHVFGTPVLHEGLIYLADCGRTFHCVEAATGRPVWTHEINGEVWASPLVADGKVYLGTRSGAYYVFATGRERQLLSEQKLDRPISATTTAANGTLYVATMTQLYAVRNAAR